MTIHNGGMTTPLPGQLSPADLALLADKITALTPGSIDRREYLAGYRAAVVDASAEVMNVYHRASAAAYAAAVDAENTDAKDDGLAEVAADLLRLAVRLDMADDAEIQRRMDALGGGDK